MVSGRSGRLRQILPTMKAFSSPKAAGTVGRWPAFGYSDVDFAAYALSTLGSGHDETQVSFPISSTSQDMVSSFHAFYAQGGQRLLGRRVLTKHISWSQCPGRELAREHCLAEAPKYTGPDDEPAFLVTLL